MNNPYLAFRHIDTAQLYGNEADIARAIATSGLKRQEVYLTTKLWESEWGYRKASGAIQDRLAALDVTYIDLLLLHTPGNPLLRAETWKALEDAHEQVTTHCASNPMPAYSAYRSAYMWPAIAWHEPNSDTNCMT